MTIEHASEVSLVLFRDRSHSYQDEYISPLQEQTATAEATLRIKISGERGTFEIPVRYFSLSLALTGSEHLKVSSYTRRML